MSCLSKSKEIECFEKRYTHVLKTCDTSVCFFATLVIKYDTTCHAKRYELGGRRHFEKIRLK